MNLRQMHKDGDIYVKGVVSFLKIMKDKSVKTVCRVC